MAGLTSTAGASAGRAEESETDSPLPTRGIRPAPGIRGRGRARDRGGSPPDGHATNRRRARATSSRRRRRRPGPRPGSGCRGIDPRASWPGSASTTCSRSAGIVRSDLRRRDHRVARVRDHDLHRGLAEERRAAGQEEIGDRAQRIDVGATVRGLGVQDLLGGDVQRRAGDRVFLRELDRRRLPARS